MDTIKIVFVKIQFWIELEFESSLTWSLFIDNINKGWKFVSLISVCCCSFSKFKNNLDNKTLKVKIYCKYNCKCQVLK